MHAFAGPRIRDGPPLDGARPFEHGFRAPGGAFGVSGFGFDGAFQCIQKLIDTEGRVDRFQKKYANVAPKVIGKKKKAEPEPVKA